MPGYEFFMKPKMSQIQISTEEVHNILYSLLLIDSIDEVQGLGEGLIEIANQMSLKLKEKNHLVMNGLYYAAIPVKRYYSFPQYLENLKEEDPLEVRDRLLNVYLNLHYNKLGKRADITSILSDENAFITFLFETFGQKKIDETVEREAFSYLSDPPRLRDLIHDHLEEMWRKWFSEEWQTVFPLLNESVQAYLQAGYDNLSPEELIHSLGCEALECDWEHLMEKVRRARTIYLVPSIHLGPYKGKMYHSETEELWIFSGSLQPGGRAEKSAELSKADLLVHFSALTDGSRMEILKLCSRGQEYSSSQLMEKLGISQSAASRHLKQLSATGFLKERRENSSKFYRIDKKNIKETLGSLVGYLELDSD